jgi:signal transduction histidine kinase
MEIVKQIMSGETMKGVEWVHSMPDGKPLPVELTMLRINMGDRYVGLGYIYDMREQIRLKMEIETALVKTQEASRAKSNFLSIMSHEMRTPMNAIIGMTAIGKKSNNIDEKNRALNKIGDASAHLLGVINDVLDMAKIEANKLELTLVEFNFEKMLQRVATVINFRVDEKQQQLAINIDPNIPNFLIGDDQHLAQVITNLLSNAVKFTPEGGEIRLDASLLGETDGCCELRIEVADNGIGIAPEHHEKLFGMFEQAESGISREYGGTGLGLVISKNIVELMGCEIWVESELGKGTRLAFTIKVRRGTVDSRSRLSPGVNLDDSAMDDDKTEYAHVGFEGKRLLLAEDVEINREILILLLEDTGIIIDCVENGLEALNMVAENPGKYDIVFMDVQMPQMDGREATRRIRALSTPESAGLPIIAMTANVFKEDVEACLAAGMDGHIGKPIDIEKVMEVLYKYLKIGVKS